MNPLAKLERIRSKTGPAQTVGIEDQTLTALYEKFADLRQVIDQADIAFQIYEQEFPEILSLNEAQAVAKLQETIVNFYPENQVNPYVSLAAQGPWLVTLHGAVLHDSGGYGMLGLGHNPSEVNKAMNRQQVMANVMTANLSHKRLADRLEKEIGHTHQSRSPKFSKFLYMNSGSEAVTVAMKIADLNAKTLTDEGAKYQGRKIHLLAHKGGFHGRTDRPAQASDSTIETSYNRCASFRDRKNLLTIEPNNIPALEKAFMDAKQNNIFIEMLLLEPVMGEGNPGLGITPEYYAAARKLTKESGTLFLIDSIQAGYRAHGCLSVLDYPGFQDQAPPDYETYSKAINAGQYPLSVLAMTETTAELYTKGVYGNTMTTNPRAIDVACAVMDQITPELRKNIQDKGKEMLRSFEQLAKEFPDVVTGVSGTGLLCALHLQEHGYKVVGKEGVEIFMRHNGIGVIHGGKNALRFTPHFNITSEEVELIISKIRSALQRGPVYS